MNQDKIILIQTSWKKVILIAPEAGLLFYENLFSADPSLKQLFKGDMAEQGKRLIQMIGLAVSKLKNLDELVPVLQTLALRHNDYGVQDAHYPIVGAALLKTLEQALKLDFTDQVKAAWAEIYNLMADIMIEACAASKIKTL